MPRRRPPTKPKGDWVECEFMASATRRGLTVSKPYGDSAPFDFIVGRHPPLYRVQVRGRALFQGGGFHCTIGKWPNRPFDWRDYDVLAFYVIPCQAWYLIPTPAIASSRWAITFFPHIPNSRGRHEKYREAWHLVGAKRTNLASTRLRSTKRKPQRPQRTWRQAVEATSEIPEGNSARVEQAFRPALSGAQIIRATERTRRSAQR